MKHDVKNAAERARRAGEEVARLVYEKQLAYGDAASIQLGLWQVLLAQYEKGGEYVIPQALIAHVPRLTRVFDRIARIVSNPNTDRLGEDPWRDLAGDAIVGIIMPRVQRPVEEIPRGRCFAQLGDHRCERWQGHHLQGIPHAYIDASGMTAWGDDPSRCGALHPELGKTCEGADGHAGPHFVVTEKGTARWDLGGHEKSPETGGDDAPGPRPRVDRGAGTGAPAMPPEQLRRLAAQEDEGPPVTAGAPEDT